MTITTTVTCDGFNCTAEREIEDAVDLNVEFTGFHVDPRDGHDCFHYCSRCWPAAKKEIEEEDA